MKKKPFYLAGTPKPPRSIEGALNPEYAKWLYHNRPEIRARQIAYRSARKAGSWKSQEGYGDVSRRVEAIAEEDRVTTRSVYRWLAGGLPLESSEAERRTWRTAKYRSKTQSDG